MEALLKIPMGDVSPIQVLQILLTIQMIQELLELLLVTTPLRF